MGICLFNVQYDLSVQCPGGMKCLNLNNLGAEEIIMYERKYWEGQECKWKQAKIDSDATE